MTMKRLKAWKGGDVDITIGAVYDVQQDHIGLRFKDDVGDYRSATKGDWDELEQEEQMEDDLISVDDMKVGESYTLVRWDGIFSDVTAGKDYKAEFIDPADGRLSFYDDVGDARDFIMGSWKRAENTTPSEKIMEDANRVLNISDIEVAIDNTILDAAFFSILSELESTPSAFGARIGDLFEYVGDHGMIDLHPMTEWEDGDTLECIDIKEKKGVNVPVMWNKIKETVSTVSPGTFRKIDHRILALMEEVGLTEYEARESLRVLDGGE